MKTEITKRSRDNKFVVWVYMVDPTYDVACMEESNIPYLSQRWVIVKICDTLKDAENETLKWKSTQKIRND